MDVRLHADGRHADELTLIFPSSAEMPRANPAHLEQGLQYPKMNGRQVFKNASVRMPEAVMAVLTGAGLTPNDIDMLITHQANMRISEMVQKGLGLDDSKVFNNIQRYGNTTAASIPLALHEARQAGKLKAGDLLCLTAFGAGFTWGSALIRF